MAKTIDHEEEVEMSPIISDSIEGATTRSEAVRRSPQSRFLNRLRHRSMSVRGQAGKRGKTVADESKREEELPPAAQVTEPEGVEPQEPSTRKTSRRKSSRRSTRRQE